MAPAFLLLVYRVGKGCRQYPFTSIEAVEAWAKRKPYRAERLNVVVCIDRKTTGTVQAEAVCVGAALRDFVELYVDVKAPMFAAGASAI